MPNVTPPPPPCPLPRKLSLKSQDQLINPTKRAASKTKPNLNYWRRDLLWLNAANTKIY